VQVLLLALALIVTGLRCWIRIIKEHRALTVPDYLVWGGWLCAVGWTACSIKALYLQIDHPLQGVELATDSVEYLVVRKSHGRWTELQLHTNIRQQTLADKHLASRQSS
jgi:hypothetical protein